MTTPLLVDIALCSAPAVACGAMYFVPKPQGKIKLPGLDISGDRKLMRAMAEECKNISAEAEAVKKHTKFWQGAYASSALEANAGGTGWAWALSPASRCWYCQSTDVYNFTADGKHQCRSCFAHNDGLIRDLTWSGDEMGDIIDALNGNPRGTNAAKLIRQPTGTQGTVTKVEVCYHCGQPEVYNFTQDRKHKQCYACYQKELARDAADMVRAGTDDKVALAVHTINTVTDFEALMPCPYCGELDWHWLRIARHKPQDGHPGLQRFFQEQKKFFDQNAYNYGRLLGASGGDHIMAFGHATPVRIIGGDEKILAEARSIRPIGVDKGDSWDYDPEEAECIRTCKTCEKEWAQK